MEKFLLILEKPLMIMLIEISKSVSLEIQLTLIVWLLNIMLRIFQLKTLQPWLDLIIIEHYIKLLLKLTVMLMILKISVFGEIILQLCFQIWTRPQLMERKLSIWLVKNGLIKISFQLFSKEELLLLLQENWVQLLVLEMLELITSETGN